MNNVYKIIPISDGSPCIILHPKQRKLLDATRIKTTIHFGFHKTEVIFKQLNTIKENEIGLSNTVIENLRLPLEVDYEISIQNDEIIIGPFIGVMITNSHKKLIKKVNKLKQIKKLEQIKKQYRLVNGVVLALSVEGIDENNSKVHGFLYNPSTKNWVEGTFPFPSVIVKRTTMPSNSKKYLKKLYGRRFFHLAGINKWKMYQRLHKNPDLLPYIPKTFLYKKPTDILKYLKELGTIYIKPISGSSGNGIEKFIAKPNQYCVKFRLNRKNETIHFSSENELLDYVKSKFKSKKFIIQQQIDIEIEKNHPIDFRIALIKNQSGQWEDIGMVARKGRKGSGVSNILNGGRMQNARSLLLTLYNLSEAEALNIRQKMSEIAIKAAREIDKYDTIFKSGVDIALDRDHHIWLIELNNRKPYLKFSRVGPKSTIKKARKSRMLYAKYLAGFPKEKKDSDLSALLW
ncbi:YheC/YheD family endospore coat-associated protein [Rummeliibacillus stabekisii]|uniref:YheC/YheD family endospore coat-associated protein n=1 Tax=Rummeliibacillus stabekisii TaxID=241244 RepID=UPI00371FEC9D